MNSLSFVFKEIFYRPLANALIFLTSFVPGHDVGIAIILLTFLVRLILFPFSHRSLFTQLKMKELEPEIAKIKKESKDQPGEEGRRLMELYRRHGVSPFSGCLTLLVQLPILIALYRVFLYGIDFDAIRLYAFLARPEFIQMKFLGVLDLAGKSWLLAALAAGSQFLQMKLAMPSLPQGGASMREEFSRAMAIQARYILPAVVFYISFRFPAALALYWTASNVFATLHEAWVRRQAKLLNADGRREHQRNN